jgi:tRNA (mo5U34)-methyltransferase
MDSVELESRINGLGRWHYRFDFDGGVSTPIWDEDRIDRHEQRARYFFDRLLQVTGGSLRGHRILDLGCNSGFWSLKAVEAGADFVFGVDGRQMHVDQANLVFEAKGVDPERYRFETGDIFGYPFGTGFDIVLCLGLMYHISKPVELFEIMSGVGAEIIVIDTAVSLAPGSVFEVRHEDLDDPRNAVDRELLLIPTRQAVIDLAGHFGYKTVPLALNMNNKPSVKGFLSRHRVAFICAKTSPLDMLPREVTPRAAQSGLRGDSVRLANGVGERLRGLVARAKPFGR